MDFNRQSIEKILRNHRENLNLIEERMSEYINPTEIPLTLEKDKKRLENEIEKLEKKLAEYPPSQPSQEEPFQPDPPPPPPDDVGMAPGISGAKIIKSDVVLMDRKMEVLTYRQILDQQRNTRILLVKGTAKMGKSRLMREFRRIAREEKRIHCALVDMRIRGESYREFLNLVVQEIDHHFRNYEDRLMQSQTNIAHPAGVQGDVNAQILASFQNQAQREVDLYRSNITRAFIDDIRLMPPNAQVVILLDAFEEAQEETRRWIFRELLIGLYRLTNVYVVIAGRALENPESTWQDVSISTELTTVTVEDYQAYCKAIGASELDAHTISKFHQAFQGVPGSFAEVVKNFIPKGGGI